MSTMKNDIIDINKELLFKVVDHDNIRKAYAKYISNLPRKRRKRYDKELTDSKVQHISKAIYKCGKSLKMLLGSPRKRTIYEHGKFRDLQIPNLNSKIIQFAFYRIFEPFIDKKINNNSFASRKGYGVHKMMKKIRRFIHQNPYQSKYCLELDIKKYYQHIDHAKLKEAFKRGFYQKKYKNMLKILYAIIDTVDEGLPIGYPGSHVLANYFLSALYNMLHQKINGLKIYVYMDNIYIFSSNKASLHRAFNLANKWCKKQKLTIKENWQLFPIDKRPITCCGYMIKGKTVKLYKRTMRKIRKNVKNFIYKGNSKYYRSLTSRAGALVHIRKEHIIYDLIKKFTIEIIQNDYRQFCIAQAKREKYLKKPLQFKRKKFKFIQNKFNDIDDYQVLNDEFDKILKEESKYKFCDDIDETSVVEIKTHPPKPKTLFVSNPIQVILNLFK